MSLRELNERFASDYQRVPVQWSGDQVAPVKVTAAGNITLIGLDFRLITTLQPIPISARESARRF